MKGYFCACCTTGPIWFNTGAKGNGGFPLQYFNIAALFIVLAFTYFRAWTFISVDKTCRAWMSMGSLMYAFVMILHLNEWAVQPFKETLSIERSPDADAKMKRMRRRSTFVKLAGNHATVGPRSLRFVDLHTEGVNVHRSHEAFINESRSHTASHGVDLSAAVMYLVILTGQPQRCLLFS